MCSSDLMTLVLADRYFYVELVDNIVGARRSGFSALAARLRERNELVKRLIGRSDPVLARLDVPRADADPTRP